MKPLLPAMAIGDRMLAQRGRRVITAYASWLPPSRQYIHHTRTCKGIIIIWLGYGRKASRLGKMARGCAKARCGASIKQPEDTGTYQDVVKA